MTPDHVLRLLAYSWADIDFQYDELTDFEKTCITRGGFTLLVDEVKAYLRRDPEFSGELEAATDYTPEISGG